MKLFLNLDHVVQEEIFFIKDILSRTLAARLFSGAKSLCNLSREHHEEHFCVIIVKLDKWCRRRFCLKILN